MFLFVCEDLSGALQRASLSAATLKGEFLIAAREDRDLSGRASAL